MLVVTGHANLCRHQQIALAALQAQSGAGDSQTVTIATPCQAGARVIELRVRGERTTVRVAVPAAGRLRVGGPGWRTATRDVHHATTVTFTIRPTAAAVATVRRRGHIRLRIHVRYTRSGSPAQTIVTRAVTFRRAR